MTKAAALITCWTGPYETINVFVTGKDEFVVFTAKSHRGNSSAGVYRWVPTR